MSGANRQGVSGERAGADTAPESNTPEGITSIRPFYCREGLRQGGWPVSILPASPGQ